MSRALARLAAALLASSVLARSSPAAGLTCPAESLDKSGLGAIPLFSALPLGRTPFARRWEKARKELGRLFPDLLFEKPENLHVTLVYMGTGWDPAKSEIIEAYGLDGPDLSSGTLVLKGEPAAFGPQKQVVALDLTSAPAEWGARLMKDRQALTEKGLRKRDMFDDAFRPHVSLASAPKPDAQREELARFQKWLSENSSLLDGLKIRVDRAVRPAFFVVSGKDESVRFVPWREHCRADK